MRRQSNNIYVLFGVVRARRRRRGFNGSASGEATRKLLAEFYDSVVVAVEYAVQAIGSNDQHAAESAVMMKDTIRDQSDRLLSRKAERLTTDDPDYLDLVRLEMAFVDQMRRIYTLSKRIAKVVLPPVLARRD